MQKTTIKDFQDLQDLPDLASLLGFSPKKLSFILYKLNDGPNHQYTEFTIKKRTGGTRAIAAPYTGLKAIQKKLSSNLQDIYMVKKAVHGFVREKTILTNAHNHSRKKYVFRIDLKNFFPTIHFGRVMGLFCAKPYSFKRKIAILIAKIACYNDVLPQGSPCSPVIANMVCAYMDKQLGDLAKECGCFYTRYADDLTFSTNKSIFPKEIAYLTDSKWEPSAGLVQLIQKHSFEINPQKTSMRTRSDRQLVTGLIVNDYPNIQRKRLKQVRAMLHDWKTNGIEIAQDNYVKKYYINNRRPDSGPNINFQNVIRGKLEFIRKVRENRIKIFNHLKKQQAIRNRSRTPNWKELYSIHKDQYYKYFQRYEQLVFRDCGSPTIIGEGETDWMHLRKAFTNLKGKGLFPELNLNIHKHKSYAIGGMPHLKDFCEHAEDTYVKFNNPVICVYDADDKDTNMKHAESQDGYISYGNNVFSIVLPKPEHRTTETFAIEQLYKNTDLLKKDNKGRRIYLSTEFDIKTGKHKTNPSIEYGKRARDGKKIEKLKKHHAENEKIFDNLVCIERSNKLENIALSKKDLAIKIMKNEPPFAELDFSSFEPVFALISKICIESLLSVE